MENDFYIEVKKSIFKVFINPDIYPLEAVYGACYVFLDKAYIKLEGDPKKEIIVKIKPKKSFSENTLVEEFYNELLNYVFYKSLSEKNQKIRESIIHRALISGGSFEDDKVKEDIEDSENIVVPWEENESKHS